MSFYVLEGELALRTGEGELRAAAGSWVQVPPGVPHAVAATGRYLDIHTPSCGFGAFLHGARRRVRSAAGAYTRPVDAERFAEHLSHPHRRGHVPADAFTGTAGGAACGDLVRIDLALDGERVAAAGFEASGCGAAIAAASAAVTLAEGAPLLDAARIGAREVAGELGGLSPGKFHAAELAADALHQALGAAAAARAALPAAPGRTLVAMSGGVDSAVAALLAARAGREAVCVTLELWRDPANDAEASCCSAHAVRLARGVAHRMGLPHLTLDLREAFAAGVVAPFLADHAAGLTPNPCVRCNGDVRLDAMLAFADRLGAAELATGHYARVTADGLLRVAADPAKDQSYMLAALAPGIAGPAALPARRADQAGGARARRARPACPWPTSASRRTCASSPAPARRRSWPATAGSARGRERSSTAPAAPSAAIAASTSSPSGSARASASAAAEPLYVLGKDAAANTVTVGPRTALATAEVAVRDAVLHRPGAEVDRVKLRYRTRPLGCRVEPAPDGRLTLRLAEPADGAAPGQVACLMRGDVVVGHGVIA